MSTFNLDPLKLNTDDINGKNLKQISDYLFMLNDQLRYSLSNLSAEDNFDKETSGFFTKIAEEIHLYAKKGELSAELSLEDGTVTLRGDRFVVDSTYLKISEDGKIKATSAEFTGAIKSGSTLDTTNFHVAANGTIYTGSSYNTAKFKVDSSGNVAFSGTIDSPNFHVDANGNIYNGAYPTTAYSSFLIDSTGELKITGAAIRAGTITNRENDDDNMPGIKIEGGMIKGYYDGRPYTSGTLDFGSTATVYDGSQLIGEYLASKIDTRVLILSSDYLFVPSFGALEQPYVYPPGRRNVLNAVTSNLQISTTYRDVTYISSIDFENKTYTYNTGRFMLYPTDGSSFATWNTSQLAFHNGIQVTPFS